MVKKRLYQALGISFIIGVVINIGIFIFADIILDIIYDTTLGSNYIRLLIPFFTIFYLEGPLISYLQAINKAGVTFKITLIGTIIKVITLAVFSLLKIGIYGLVVSEIINIFFVVGFNYIYTIKSFK